MSRDGKIRKALEKLVVATFMQLKNETGLTPGSLGRGLKSLKQSAEVLQLTERGPYALAKNESKLKKYLKNNSKSSFVDTLQITDQCLLNALKELRFLLGTQNPPIEYIGSHPLIRAAPEKIESRLYKVGWRKPSGSEEDEGRFAFSILSEQAYRWKEGGERFEKNEELAQRVENFLELFPEDARARAALSLNSE